MTRPHVSGSEIRTLRLALLGIAAVLLASVLAGCASTAHFAMAPAGVYNAVTSSLTLLLIAVVVWQYKLLRKPAPAGLEATVSEALRARIRASRECYTILDSECHPIWQEVGTRFPLRWSFSDIAHRDLRERIPAGPEGDVRRDAYRASLAGVVPDPYAVEDRDADGRTVWLEVEHTPQADGGVTVRYRDVTAARAVLDRAERERDTERARAVRAETAAADAARAQTAMSRLPPPTCPSPE